MTKGVTFIERTPLGQNALDKSQGIHLHVSFETSRCVSARSTSPSYTQHIPKLQAKTPGREQGVAQEIRQRAAQASVPGAGPTGPSRSASSAANSGQGMIKSIWDQALGTWREHRKHSSAANAPTLCNKPASSGLNTSTWRHAQSNHEACPCHLAWLCYVAALPPF